uniref:Uncharacterized protein n=1 Tax=Serinus canaria TaxID=9135 RepID=A0A8C9MGD3_SERCA
PARNAGVTGCPAHRQPPALAWWGRAGGRAFREVRPFLGTSVPSSGSSCLSPRAVLWGSILTAQGASRASGSLPALHGHVRLIQEAYGQCSQAHGVISEVVLC